MGIDLISGGKSKRTKRTAPRSDDIYLKLIVKLYRFLVRRTGSANVPGFSGLGIPGLPGLYVEPSSFINPTPRIQPLQHPVPFQNMDKIMNLPYYIWCSAFFNLSSCIWCICIVIPQERPTICSDSTTECSSSTTLQVFLCFFLELTSLGAGGI
ncbi:hypothetical protein POM88_049651 [Heracleum sosnowskyi]|uniref:Large ribosomal subunit protein uL15/eL18 domain-containing protein n=1 Tax=Heracleum sosnowskyi TaxID=360622 RepID=A0AAD8GYL6_9APIA|nr:hypothetical protein POM88_049651 [Heracleum sosnowskyi]